MGYVMKCSTLLQSTWKEERIIYRLDEVWENGIRITISASGDGFFALGSVRECNALGKYMAVTLCMKYVCN
jgi:hypothetical protein